MSGAHLGSPLPARTAAGSRNEKLTANVVASLRAIGTPPGHGVETATWVEQWMCHCVLMICSCVRRDVSFAVSQACQDGRQARTPRPNGRVEGPSLAHTRRGHCRSRRIESRRPKRSRPGGTMGDLETTAGRAPAPSNVTITHVIYALHTLSVLIGLTSAATIVGAFVFSLPSIVAVILNYAKRSDVRGTLLESHFRWQIRTFWYAALWILVAVVLLLTIIGIPLALL